MRTTSSRPASERRRSARLDALGLLVALWALGAAPVWALGNFTRHLTITVGAGVVGGPHANFPLVVDVTNATADGLKTTGNGGQVQSANGYDIVFRGEADSPGICAPAAEPCMLDHEIELYDGAAGRVVAWVRVPSLANGRILHMYYGNNLITSSTEATSSVFDANYVGVWHLKESGTGKLNEYRDSSRYGNHGQGGEGDPNAVPKRIVGKIGYAQHFDNLVDSTYDFVDAGQDGTMNITGNQLTVEAWIRHNITVNTPHGCANPPYDGNCPAVKFPTNHYGILNHKGYGDGYRFFLMGDPTWCPRPSGTLTAPCLGMGIPEQRNVISTSQYGAYPYTAPGTTDPVTNNVWHHVVGSYDGTEMKLHLNGVKLRAEAAPLYSTGNATVASGSPTVTFAGGASLPATVGPGDVLTFTGATVENLVVLTRDSASQVTLTTNAGAAHAAQSYRITNPFKTGNVSPSLAEQHVWIGNGDQQQNVGWSAEFEGDIDEVRLSMVARSDNWIATEYANQNNPGTFSTAGAPGIVAQALSTLTTVYRSIGTNAANLYTTGTASLALNGTVVTFAGGANLPANVGQGDQLDFTGGPAETLYILSRDSATQVTVQTPATSAHAAQTYTIRRAYNTLQAWENALPADLVAANVRHVGVAYNDGPFAAGVTFSGSVTDPARDIRLTTSLGARQHGTPSSGVVLDNGGTVTPAISVSDDHVTVEFFEIKGGSGTGAHGIEIASVNPANLGTVRYNLIHNTGGDGIRLSDADSVVDVYNNFIFGAPNGIRLLVDLNASARVNIFSNTVYGCTTAGITSRNAGGTVLRQTRMRVTLRNNIIHTNTAVDQDVARGFDRAYFCTGITGNDPTPGTCSAYIGHINQPGLDNQLSFTSATRCLYLGSNDVFRGVAVHLAAGGTNSPDMQWDYWSGAAWSSLETGPFEDYNFQWDGFAYWPDDPPGWATRLIDVDATPRYWVRVCRASGTFGTLPTESIITRADVSVASRYNLATDYTGYYASQWRGVGVTGLQDTTGTGVLFNSATDLHIQAGSMARDVMLDVQRQDTNAGTPGRESSALSARFRVDIDLQGRPPGPNGACFSSAAACWDIGADEYGAPTAVGLMSFSAVPGDGSVTLEWRTGSELDNLGFHLYRGPSADGPWMRLTSTLIPGLGSSPLGQAYSWLDSGLTNGVRYYYRLEDVDTSSLSTSHGPVSAVPEAVATPPGEGGGGGGGGDGTGGGGGEPGSSSCPSWVLASAPEAASPSCTKHGDPDAVSLDILSRDASSATLELRTGGFWTLEDESGTVRVFVPSLEFPSDPHAPALPHRRALVPAVVGKGVQLASVEALDLQPFAGLRPSAVGAREMTVSRDGTVRPGRRALTASWLTRGYLPREAARLVGTVFQGETKSAVVEILPLRYSASRQGLVLASRVRVKLSFTGVAEREVGTGTRGRAMPRRPALTRNILARLYTTRRGLYAAKYEDLFPQNERGFSTADLSLRRQSEAVRFHVEPPGPVFRPGSVLYFFADRESSSTDYSSEVAYELVRAAGAGMSVSPANPAGAAAVSYSTGLASFETNRIYQPGLLEAPDVWLWDAMVSGVSRAEGFTLSGVDTSGGGSAHLAVLLQGGSESGTGADHHVRVSVNGVEVGEATFAGKQPHRLEADLPASLLREGTNELAVANLGDGGVYSLVFLDRFEVRYAQVSVVRGGVFEGVWAEGGTAEVSGLSGSPVILRDPGLPGATTWLSRFEAAGTSVRFQAEAGRRYLVVSPEGILAPRVEQVAVFTLRERTKRADYLVIAPQAFLEAAAPLLERRRSQGLVSQAIAFEQIVSEFGHGQPSAEAIRSFLTYAYHSWQRPSPRYVLLLGDATDDPRHFLPTSWASPLPALGVKTSYLWTVSDPALGAVNGDDALPDLAIGRLPATTVEQAEALVSKVLAWEDSGQGLSSSAVLVADTPDRGGDFEADVEDVRITFLSDRTTTTLKVRELGSEARPAILGAFDAGASLVSYVGHGGTAVWSSSNVLNSWDAASLLAQSRQPLLLTLNCLNGYFVAPNLDSLPEALLKAAGRGVVAAVSPSGLSLDGPAHEYHRAMMGELVSGRHERLGDAILAAQRDYAETGFMPELLGVYQLLGDPAMRIR